MPRPTRLTLLLIPLTLSVLTQALPGFAQQPTSARFAFADTTLLRDTLGLSFDRLFPVADSLQLTPDTLRALMIRFKFTMPRMLHLADSLSVTVDSVGAYMNRQILNPLAGGAQRHSNDFTYTSGYDIQQTSTTWTNSSTYRMFRGPLYLNNTTNIELQRIQSSHVTSLRQNRDATTELGLTANKNMSFGARSYQLRFFSADPGSPTSQDETKNEYGVTARAAQSGRRLNGEMNLNGGYLDDKSATDIKRGISGSADARLRFASPGLLTHDLSGSLTGNVSHSRPPTYPITTNTSDLSTNVRGNLVVLPNSPVRLNVNYAVRNTRIESPVDTTHVNSVTTQNNSVDGTMRVRVDNDRYLDLTGSLGRSGSSTGTRDDNGGHAALRWMLMGWAVDASYSDTRETSIFTRQRGGGGYDENGVSRESDATFVRNFGAKVVGRIVANIGLDRYRYVIKADSATPPSPRDAYRQTLRTEVNYNPSEKVSSRVAAQVSLNRTINIAAATTGSNTDTRSYRSEWSWSYRVMPSLTVTQNDQIQADYLQYPFSSARNTLTLSYNNTTSLSAALPGNLSIDVSHNTSQAPRGSYTLQPEGYDALLLSDDSRNYGLSASVRYAPFNGISLHVDPRYSDSERSGTVNNVQAKQRTDKRLDFAGGVDVNLHVGRKGMLTGRLNRTFTDQRTINYTNNVATPTPRSQTDYWNGNLQLTWTL